MEKIGAPVACRFPVSRWNAANAITKNTRANAFLNYNGVGKNVLEADVSGESKQKGALVFVGNVKPHKGLKTLVEAYSRLPAGYTLKIVGEKDNFLTGENTSGALKRRRYVHGAGFPTKTS